MVIIYVYIKLLFTNFELIELDLAHWKIYLIACHILVNNEASRLILVQRQLDEVKIKENEHALTLPIAPNLFKVSYQKAIQSVPIEILLIITLHLSRKKS